MRLINFQRGREVRVGVQDGTDAVDVIDALGGEERVAAANRAMLGDSISFIASGPKGLRLARKAVRESRKSGRGRTPMGKVRLRAPIQPTSVLCSGANYWDHRDEIPKRELKEPEFFVKAAQGVIGPRDNIVLDPAVTKKLDYETELVIVMGKPGRHIPKSKALEHVFGYTIMNDITARDRQVLLKPDGGVAYDFGPGKNFDTCAPLGPCIVTTDELTRPHELRLRTLVNKEIRQNNSTDHMLWQVADLVKFFSTFFTLQPGIIISTGTPGGTGFASDVELGGRPYARDDVVRPQGYLRPGDVLISEIEQIGALRNKIVRYKRKG